MCFIRNNIAYQCPNMIHFNVVDFSEHHTEEMISFFWRSVYKPAPSNFLSAGSLALCLYVILHSPVKVQRSLAPLSRFWFSIPSAHEQQCCRFQSLRTLCDRSMKCTSKIYFSAGIHDNGPRDHELYVTFSIAIMCGLAATHPLSGSAR